MANTRNYPHRNSHFVGVIVRANSDGELFQGYELYLDLQQNRASLPRYLENLRAGRLPLGRGYVLNPTERAIRELVLQLKLGEARFDYFRERYDFDVLETLGEPLRRMEADGHIRLSSRGVTTTRTGRLRVDRLLPHLYLRPHQGLRYS